MKKSKKILSVLLLAAFVMGSFPAVMAEGVPEPIFSLDVSNFDAASELPSKGLADAKNSGVTITANGSISGGTDENLGNIKYVEVGGKNNSVKVDGIFPAELAEKPLSKSVEMWVNISSDMGPAEDKSTNVNIFEIRPNENITDSITYTSAAKSASPTDVADYLGRLLYVHAVDGTSQVKGGFAFYEKGTYFANYWHHLVFTSTYDGSKAIGKAYMDGMLIGSHSQAVSADKLADIRDTSLFIGGMNKSAFEKVNALNVYNTELTEENVEELFNTRKGEFAVSTGDVSLNFTGFKSTYTSGERDNGIASSMGIKANSSLIGIRAFSPYATAPAGHTNGGSFLSKNDKVSYIESDNKNGGVCVYNVFSPLNGGETNPGDLSVEFWAYLDSDISKLSDTRIFSASDDSNQEIISLRTYLADGYIGFKCWPGTLNGTTPKGGTLLFAAEGNAEKYCGKWNHYVFTRSVGSDGKLSAAALYVNGERVGDVAKGLSAYPLADLTNARVYIGSENASAIMKVGSFNIIKNSLTEADIQERYNSEKEMYEAADYSIKLTNTSWSYEKEADSDNYAVKISGKVLNNTENTLECAVIMGVYAPDGSLEAIDVKNLYDTSAVAAGDAVELNAEAVVAKDERYKVRFFMWNNAAGMKPIEGADLPEIIYTKAE